MILWSISEMLTFIFFKLKIVVSYNSWQICLDIFFISSNINCRVGISHSIIVLKSDNPVDNFGTVVGENPSCY